MNPYLSGIMALSQLSPDQFDMGMQRFQQIQQMDRLRRQAGLTAGTGQAIPNQPTQVTGVTQGPYSLPPRRAPQNFDERPPSTKEAIDGGLIVSDVNSLQPTMSPFSNAPGSFGTGAMPYTQPYYQRSFNPYSGGFGMGQPMSGGGYGGKGGGSPYGGSYGRPSPYSSGYGMGFQQQPSTSPMGGGKGGGMPAYGGGYGGKGGRR